jgi:hypothetical protein
MASTSWVGKVLLLHFMLLPMAFASEKNHLITVKPHDAFIFEVFAVRQLYPDFVLSVLLLVQCEDTLERRSSLNILTELLASSVKCFGLTQV